MGTITRQRIDEWLHLYVEEKHSLTSIARRCGSGMQTVRKYLVAEGVEIRSHAEQLAATRERLGRDKRAIPRPPDKELEHLYVDQLLTMPEVADRYDVSPTTVHNWLESAGIDRRTTHESRRVRMKQWRPDRSELERLYDEFRLSSRLIAELYGVSSRTAAVWVRRAGLSTRGASEAAIARHELADARKELCKAVYEGDLFSLAAPPEDWEPSESIPTGESLLALLCRLESFDEVAAWVGLSPQEVERRIAREEPRLVTPTAPSRPEGPYPAQSWPVDEWRRLYLEERMSCVSIARQHGCATSTVNKYLKANGVQMRSIGRQRRIEHRRQLADSRPSTDELKKLYVEDGHSMASLARLLDEPRSRIRRWIDEAGIQRRTRVEQQKLTARLAIPPKHELEKLYIEKGLSIREIAGIHGVSEPLAGKWLKTRGIETLDPDEAKRQKRRRWDEEHRPSRDELLTAYHDENTTKQDLCERFGVGRLIINRWLAYHDIHRTPSHQNDVPEADLDPEPAGSLLDEIAASLSQRDWAIVEGRFWELESFEELAQQHELKSRKVRQIFEQTIDSLRRKFRERAQKLVAELYSNTTNLASGDPVLVSADALYELGFECPAEAQLLCEVAALAPLRVVHQTEPGPG